MKSAETTSTLEISPIIPEIKTSLFDGHEDASFVALSVADPFNGVKNEEEFWAARKLRANTYIDECKFLPEAARDLDGGEHDKDDARSEHFVVVEKGQETAPSRLIGTMRSIIKRDEGDLLPVEKIYPEVFAHTPAAVNSVEASRFISRHENRLLQNMGSMTLIKSIVCKSAMNDNEPIYAVVEDHLRKLFVKVGLPFDEIAEPKNLPEYGNTLNMALRFEPKDIIDAAIKGREEGLKISLFFNEESGKTDNGLGYYDQYMMNRVYPF